MRPIGDYFVFCIAKCTAIAASKKDDARKKQNRKNIATSSMKDFRVFLRHISVLPPKAPLAIHSTIMHNMCGAFAERKKKKSSHAPTIRNRRYPMVVDFRSEKGAKG